MHTHMKDQVIEMTIPSNFRYVQQPTGECPTWATGIVLETGQAFYLGYRGRRARLFISVDAQLPNLTDDEYLARVCETMLDESFDYFSIDEANATLLIERWVGEYIEMRGLSALSAAQLQELIDVRRDFRNGI